MHTSRRKTRRIDSPPISTGAQSLAISMKLREEFIRKRTLNSDCTLREYLLNCYQSLTGESLNDYGLTVDDIFQMISSETGRPYANDIEFENRMTFLQDVFRKEIYSAISERREYRSKGYTLVNTLFCMIIKICQRLRNSSNFDLVEWFQGLELVSNIAELTCIAIKLGASHGFHASESFINSYIKNKDENSSEH